MSSLRTAVAAVTLAFGLAAAAAAIDVDVTYDKSVDFSKLKTFKIEIGTSWGNPIGEKNALEEFTQAFTAKGWTLTGEEQADVEILLHGATKEKQRLDTFYTGGRAGWRWGGVGSATTTVREYTVGTLVVDVFRTPSHDLIWRGVAEDELKSTQDKREKQLEKAANRLLKDFPPGAPAKKP